MNKRKIVMMALSIMMVAILAIGGSLAYLTDTDTKTNTFTFGNVDIQLNEVFPETELKPGENNALQKVVTVENTGSEDAYMWIELWIPTRLDAQAAIDNSLHFNPFNTYKDADGNIVLCRMAEANAKGYELVAETVEVALGTKNIDGIDYNGYREYIKNDTAKKTGESTAALLARVFMDKDIKQCEEGHAKDVNECMVLKDGTHYAGTWEIIINAYGIQADGFANIEEAIAAYDGKKLEDL